MPRTDWQTGSSLNSPPSRGPQHANPDRVIAWGHQLRLVHNALRNQLTRIREAIEGDEPPPTLAGDVELFCGGFCVALVRHHTAEDESLFPRVALDHPELASVVAKLREDHRILGQLIAELESVLHRQPPRSPDEIVRHLDGIEAIMTSHFGFEERQLTDLMDALTDHTVSINDLLGVEQS